MLEKTKKDEVWMHKKGNKIVGIVARVPELLRLNLISTGPDFEIGDLNKWLYLTKSGDITEYDSFEEAEAELT